MLLEAILKHSQRAGLVDEANALEQVRHRVRQEYKMSWACFVNAIFLLIIVAKTNEMTMHCRRDYLVTKSNFVSNWVMVIVYG